MLPFQSVLLRLELNVKRVSVFNTALSALFMLMTQLCYRVTTKTTVRYFFDTVTLFQQTKTSPGSFESYESCIYEFICLQLKKNRHMTKDINAIK